MTKDTFDSHTCRFGSTSRHWNGYTATECHAFVLQRCLESYVNTAIDWRYQSNNGRDMAIKPYAMLHWAVHCKYVGDPWTSIPWPPISEVFFFRDATNNGQQ